MDRIALLTSFIESQPENPFPRYGLAMEHRGRGDHQAAQPIFDALVETFPDYTPTYLMAGNNLVDLGRKQDAAAIYRRGIDACRKKGESHALSELQNALDDLDLES